MEITQNTLFYGDNLKILREHIEDNCIDLIYLDPPFNSKATYNVLFKEPTGEPSEAQITAFEDTWHWTQETQRTFEEIVDTAPANVVETIKALKAFIGRNDMMAYLTNMFIRLLELKRVLKNTGSIYLHCDPTSSHYLKLVMDAIFGFGNIRNEIIWQKIRIEKAQSNQFAKLHDIIFYYTKSDKYFFNQQRTPPSQEYIDKYYAQVEPETGRRYQLVSFLQGGQGPPRQFGDRWLAPPPGRHWIWSQDRIDQAMLEGRLVFTDPNKPRLKRYLDEHKGRNVGSIWTDIYPINAVAKERLGYPTQKPEALLERIIKASSNEGDVILDPFCGCGTTIAVAQRLNKIWIGIDITHLAINLIKWRMKNAFDLEADKDYDVVGEPEDLSGARELFSQNRYQFQWWTLSLINARPYGDKRKGADTGIDGYIYYMEGKDIVKKVIVQVKGGHVSVAQIRDLIGVMDREKAELSIFITLEHSTRKMDEEANAKGFYKSPVDEVKYPRVQIFTIEELLEGNKPKLPPSISPFKRAERYKKEEKTLDLHDI